MRSLTFVFFFFGLLFYLPSSVSAAATMGDYWQGKAQWRLVNKFTVGNSGWEYGYGAGAHIDFVGNTWYLFGRKYYWGQGPNCPDGNPMGIAVRKSTDRGQTWSNPVDIITPLNPGSPWECGAIDGDAYFNTGENKWHYLFQCMGNDKIWNGCEVEKNGADPMGLFQQTHTNPVIKGGPDRGLWKDICTDPGKDCYNISGGNNVFDAGTFDIFNYSGGYYWVSFHGYDGASHGEHAYRGIAKTPDFINWIAGNSSQGVPADAILDKNDALNFRESWQGEPKGFLAGNILSDGGYYYLISEVPDLSPNCIDGQDWDWGVFRSNSLTNTKWESFPLGNPFLYSSKKPERNGKSIGCTPAYGRIFRDPESGKIYLNVTRDSMDNEYNGIYLYELVPSNNVLQNANLWKCSSEHWQRMSPGGNTTNLVAYRYPNESSDGNCFLSFNCGGTSCDPGQSIYQDADVGSIPYRKIAYGGKFATEGGTGSLLLDLLEFNSSGAVINETKTNVSVGQSYQAAHNQIALKDATTKVRFQVYMVTNNGFKADEMFVEPIADFSSPSPEPSFPPPSQRPGPRITSILFNGGASPETAKPLDLTGATWTSFLLSNNIGNSVYSSSVDVIVSSGEVQVTRKLKVNFFLAPDASPKPPPRGFEIGIEAGEQHDTSRVGSVEETGAKWVRLNFVGNNWTAGSSDVTKYNSIINAYLQKNIKIIGLIGAQSIPGGYDRSSPSSFIPKFTQAVGSIADRFGDRVKVYELFNEPNDWAGGQSAQLPERYFAESLASVYRKIKPTHPDVQLISGPLFSHDLNDGAAYLQGTYLAGKGLPGLLNWEIIKSETGSYPLDGVGYHIYVAQGMGDREHVESKVRGNIDAVNAVINTFDPGKKLWITEIGWGTGEGRVTEEVQAANLEKAYQVMGTHPAVRLGMWFTLVDFDSSEWGLLRPDGNRKPAWDVFKRLNLAVPAPSPSPSVAPPVSPAPSSIEVTPPPTIPPIVFPSPTPTPSPSQRPSASPAPSPSASQDSQLSDYPEDEPDLSGGPFDFPATTPIPQIPEVRIILVGSQPIDTSGQSPLFIRLVGEEGKRASVLVPVAVSFSQGGARNMAVQFNYAVPGAGRSPQLSQPNQRSQASQGSQGQREVWVYKRYDLNSDNTINSIDVTIFFNGWRTKQRIDKQDFNGDGVINSVDYAMLKNVIGKKSSG